MTRRGRNHQLAALLAEADWSAAQLARRVNALGGARGLRLRYDRTAVAHWLAGTRPRRRVADVVAEVLSQATGRTVTPDDTGLAPLARARGEVLSPAVDRTDPVRRLLTLCRTDIHPGLRSVLLNSPYITDFRPRWPLPPGDDAEDLPTAHTPWEAHSLEEAVTLFHDLAARHPGPRTRAAAAAFIAGEAGPGLFTQTRSPSHAALLVPLSQLAHLLGSMSGAAGHDGLAQDYFRTACALSARAGDHITYAITVRSMSTQAHELGHPMHALELAERAAMLAPRETPPEALAYLLAGRALARAAQGLGRGARDDLRQAERHHARAGEDSAPGAFTAYPRAGLDYQRARTLLVLGDRTGALHAFQESLEHRDAEHRRARALSHARYAEALLSVGHLDAACAQWRDCLALLPTLPPHQARHILRTVVRRLYPYRHHGSAQHVLLLVRAQLTTPR
ncbi:hypothetical protein [Streptomyces sp. NPDC059009]|uniref:hypothetical protein n=1 Tax=Streptomyces sp. NPDC059009 TaxID=3346694 RepID=UPI003674AE1C